MDYGIKLYQEGFAEYYSQVTVAKQTWHPVLAFQTPQGMADVGARRLHIKTVFSALQATNSQ